MRHFYWCVEIPLTQSRLPFFTESSCALGVVIITYLDELFTREDPTSEVTRREMSIRMGDWFKYIDFAVCRKDAFNLWDAVRNSTHSSEHKTLIKILGLPRSKISKI